MSTTQTSTTQFMKHLKQVRQVTNKIAGIGNENIEITWFFTNNKIIEKSLVHSNNLANYANFGNTKDGTVSLAIMAAAASEKGVNVGPSSQLLYGEGAGLAPFFASLLPSETGLEIAKDWTIKKAGHGKPDIIPTTLAKFIEEQENNVPLGFNYTLISAFLPAPQNRDEYTSNFAFLAQSAAPQTFYSANIFVDDWHVKEMGFLVPYYPTTQLMDYSKSNDLHFFSATPISQLDRIEKAQASNTCYRVAIVFTPVAQKIKEPEIVFNWLQNDSLLSTKYGPTKGISAGIDRTKIGTGASSGLQSDIVEVQNDPLRKGFVFIVEVNSVIIKNAINVIGQAVESVSNLVADKA